MRQRPLKFRAFDGTQMVKEQAYIQIWGHGEIFVFDEDSGLWGNDSEIIVMQYTGLKDGNEVDIYEGDLIKHGDKAYEIEFSEDHGGWMISSSMFHHAENIYKRFDCDIALTSEVIGNKFENPELLP